MRSKPTYIIKVWEEAAPEVYGIGECGLFPGLSCDDVAGYEDMLRRVCEDVEGMLPDLRCYPSILMGVETALADLHGGGGMIQYDSPWVRGQYGIRINGLIWMGSQEQMAARIREKLAAGFRCIKLKIGGIDFDREVELLQYLRDRFSPAEMEIRLDANGAFAPEDALRRLNLLARYSVHSIEQPIMAGQWREMARVCANSPIPIALDEELIGINDEELRVQMIDTIRPQYIILKPTLHGGFSGSDQWIEIAESHGVGWWATSALESNIGLNAIAQWVAAKGEPCMVQGLGTGNLYINNVASPLEQTGDRLYYRNGKSWMLPQV